MQVAKAWHQRRRRGVQTLCRVSGRGGRVKKSQRAAKPLGDTTSVRCPSVTHHLPLSWVGTCCQQNMLQLNRTPPRLHRHSKIMTGFFTAPCSAAPCPASPAETPETTLCCTASCYIMSAGTSVIPPSRCETVCGCSKMPDCRRAVPATGCRDTAPVTGSCQAPSATEPHSVNSPLL